MFLVDHIDWEDIEKKYSSNVNFVGFEYCIRDLCFKMPEAFHPFDAPCKLTYANLLTILRTYGDTYKYSDGLFFLTIIKGVFCPINFLFTIANGHEIPGWAIFWDLVGDIIMLVLQSLLLPQFAQKQHYNFAGCPSYLQDMHVSDSKFFIEISVSIGFICLNIVLIGVKVMTGTDTDGASNAASGAEDKFAEATFSTLYQSN